jgi:hypothetical protein
MTEHWIIALLIGAVLGGAIMLFSFCTGWATARRAAEDRQHMTEVLHELDRRACAGCTRYRTDPARDAQEE